MEDSEDQNELTPRTSEVEEAGVEVEAIQTVDTINTVNTLDHDVITLSPEDEKSIDQQVSEIFDIPVKKSPRSPPPKKFSRIREFVQNLNSDLLATLYESEKRHKEDLQKVRDQLDTQEEKNEALQFKINKYAAQEQEHVTLVKRASEKIKRLEASEENHKAYVQMAGERIAFLSTQEAEKARVANEKIKVMEAREEKVLDLARKAATKIKDLESFKKKQTANAKIAVKNIQTLKQMLLEKHQELQDVRDKALTDYEQLLKELENLKEEQAERQVALEEANKKYKAEHELRKADQKKIYSLRRMIEHYDDGVESTWSDLSQALSEEEIMTPWYVYRESTSALEEDIGEVKEKVLAKIPEEVKSKYGQVGFFNTNDYHFPVLALGPFDVPPGAIRNKWMEKAISSLGIYYYGQEDASMAYDMIPVESFIPYDEGVAMDFHIIPTTILEKSLHGEELTPIEQIYEDGIKRANADAQLPADDRHHPLKNFEEFAGQSPDFAEDRTEGDINLRPEELRIKFMASIGLSSGAEGLQNELGKIKDEELLAVASRKNGKGQKTREKKLHLNVEVNCEDSCDASAVSAKSFDSDSCADTLSSLEEQMHSFMKELAANKRNLAVRKTNALPTCHEEKRDVLSSETGESSVNVTEARDEVQDKERATTSSFVQQRLKMFKGPQTKLSKTPVVPDSSTKDVMKMWQMKAGKVDNGTPKLRNTSPSPKVFSFYDPYVHQTPTGQRGSTQSVTIPKNIQRKIEVGEALTECEKQILEGIERINAAKSSGEQVADDMLLSHSSTISGVTIESNDIYTNGEQQCVEVE